MPELVNESFVGRRGSFKSFEKTTRHELGQDKFIERVWQWKTDKGGTIIKQLKRMGASCDWDRERFTMDEGLSKAVREVFVRLYNEGLIYKGDYIVNWCPRCLTALADDEVEHDPTHGKLYHLGYPYADGSGSVVIATTRPETMLGDTAVAVHPEDERYAGLEKSASACRWLTASFQSSSITMSSASSARARSRSRRRTTATTTRSACATIWSGSR